ncbi:MAG: hypothetical protein ACAI43_15175 [Phycisphaerae bacterium]|nr:hypothetical protein [Tepidisphaeraceae bacterium]
MKLLNVKLDEGDARKAEALRKQGIQLSALVRAAIRTEYARRQAGPAAVAAARLAAVAEAIALYPAPPGTKPRGYDLADRHQARGAILKQMKRSKRRAS